ncbi:MAG: cytochrome c biogenesis protein ResB [Candidatus Eremiobacteraeota bacterium]|nr:cytochrome c biogenesis protein ResB [Candidatus Eremiobacteraeota bacterium]
MSAPTQALRTRSLYDQTLDVLSNVMFPVVVFAVWAALTLIGTSVDQNIPPEQYYQEYPAPVANAILRLHLTNIFHSWPYIALVLLLLVSMTVCTFRRVIPKRFPKDRALPIENFGLHAQRQSALDFETTSHVVDEYAARRGFAVRTQAIDGAHWLFADKQKWARYGVLVAHVGFAVIVIGVFIGWLLGYRGELQIYEGQTASVPQAGLLVTLSHFVGRFQPVQTKQGVVYQASRFQSDVHVAGSGGDTNASILVNHPYTSAHGVYLYQASYGFGGDFAVLRNGKPVALPGINGRLGPQDVIALPGTSRVIEYGTMLGPSDPSQAPAGVPLPKVDTYAIWAFHDQIPVTQKPILLAVGQTYDVGDGYVLKALPPVAWSGLTYRYDPGELWVGAGALILTAGFVMALFFMPIKLYARVRRAAGATVVDVAATTTKGNAMYEDDFDALVNGLADRLAPPASGPIGETVNAYA